MTVKTPVYTELAECQDCYKCIRKCPVKSIRVEKGRASVVSERCISCGRCVVNCPSHAKQYRSDVEKVRLLLAGGKKTYVSLAPSFVSEFSAWKREELVAALKQLGFYAVSETALGADFLSARIARDLEADGGPPKRLMISSACPAIVEYIKLYAPRLAPYISSHASPLLTHARFLRSRFGTDGETAVVFIGPCIAKKREADLYDTEIDAAITFKELSLWLQKEKITPQAVTVTPDCDFTPRRSAKGAFFPIEGGEITAFSAYLSSALPKITTVSASGIKAVQEALEGFDPESLVTSTGRSGAEGGSPLETPLFLELLACPGGCVNGPGMTSAASGILRRARLYNFACTADSTLDSGTLAALPSTDADFPASSLASPVYTEAQIAEALRTVGKFSLADRLNCASCGYDTCRDFALALLDGRAEKAMCASYMRKLANKTANGLIRAIPSGIVIVGSGLRIIECNEQFAKLLGAEAEEIFSIVPGMEGADLEKVSPFAQYFRNVLDLGGPDYIQTDVHEGKKIFHLTVFAVEKGETAAGVLDDITAPRVRIDKTVERAREIIKKNVAVVQQIAFLLGENAAESEAILNSIIESYTSDDEGREGKHE